jgi:hypothetical protein
MYCIEDKAVWQYEQFSVDEGRKACSNLKDLLKFMWEGDFHKVYPVHTYQNLCNSSHNL